MNPFKKLAGQTAIYGLPTIIGRFLNYLLVPLYSYSFATSEYGIVTELYAYVSFLLVFLTYGMETAVFKFSHEATEKNKAYTTAFLSISITSLLFLILLLFYSGRISILLEYPGKEYLIIQTGIMIFFDALSAIPFAKLRIENKAAKFAKLKSLNIFINISLNVFFIGILKPSFESGSGFLFLLAEILYNPEIGIAYIFLSNLIASGITFLLLLFAAAPSKLEFDKALLKKMLFYAFPLLIAGFAGMINETFDRILLKYLLPEGTDKLSEIGVYGACYKLSILMTIFIQTYRFAAEPFFFNNAMEKDIKKLYADLMKIFIIACFFIFLATNLFMEVLQYFIDEPYRRGLNIVPVLLLANLFLGIYFNLSIWYKLSGQTKFGAYFSIFGAGITLVFNLILIPVLGFTGAAWTTLICYGSMMILSYFTGQKYYPVEYDLKKIAIYLILTLFVFFLDKQIVIEDLVFSLSLNTLLLFFYTGLILFLEKDFFKRVLTIKTE